MNKIFTFMRESSTARFLIPAGIMLIVFGIVMLVINVKNQDYIETQSIVSNVSLSEEEYIDANGDIVQASYNVTVKYSVNGKEYEAVIENTSKYSVGDKMKIYYDPEDPSQITQIKSFVLPMVIIVAGIAALVGGIISAVKAIKKHNEMKEQERNWENA